MNMNNIPTRVQVLGGTCQQPSAQFEYYSNKLTSLLSEYREAVRSRNAINASITGFEVRSILKEIRLAYKVNNKEALNRLNLIKDPTMYNILQSDFVGYDARWLLPNTNKVSPKRMESKMESTRTERNKRKQIDLSIQQKRKLKRNLFGSVLDSAVEYQVGFSPFSKVDTAMEDISRLTDHITDTIDESVRPVISDIQSMRSTLEAFKNQLEGGMDEFRNSKFAAAATNVAAGTESFVEFIKSIIHWIEKSAPFAIEFTSLMLFMYLGRKILHYELSGEQVPFAYRTLFFALALYISYKITNTVKTFCVTSLLQWFDTVRAQSGTFSMSSFATMILSALHIKIGDKKKMDNFISFLTTFDRRKKSMEEIFSWIKEGALRILNLALATIGMDKIYNFQYGESMESDSIFNVYESILRRIDEGSYVFDAITYAELLDLYNACTQYLRVTRETPDNKGLLAQIRGVYSFCVAKRTAMADAHWQNVGYRPEPVCLVLIGSPGVGKTQSVEYIAAEYCARTLPDSEHDTLMREGTAPYMYVRQDENEYWEGYRNKHVITVIDDLGQRRSNVGDDDAFANLIRAVNSFPYQLHMAELTKKENTMFSSRLVIVTTNMYEFNPTTLYSSEAINRRMRFKFKVVVKPEYANAKGEIDPSKLPLDENGIPYFDPREVNTYLSVNDAGEPVPREGRTHHTFEQLMDMTVAQNAFKDALRDTKQKRVDAMIRERLGKVAHVEPQIDVGVVKDPFDEYIQNTLRELLGEGERLSDQWQSLYQRTGLDLKLTNANLVFKQVNGYITEDIIPLDVIHQWWMNEIANVSPSNLRSAFLYTLGKFKHFGAFIQKCYTSCMSHVEIKLSFYFVCAIASIFLASYAGDALFGSATEIAMRSYKRFRPDTVRSEDALEHTSQNHAAYFDAALEQSTAMRNTRGARRYTKKVSVVSQGSNAMLDIIQTLSSNVYEMHVQKNGEDFSKFGTVTFTHNRILMMPFHFMANIIDAIDEKVEAGKYIVKFIPADANSKRIIEVTFAEMCEGIIYMPKILEDNDVFVEDVTFVRLPRYVPSQRDIRKHFIKESEAFENPDICLVGMNKGMLSNVHGKGIQLTKEQPCLVYATDAPSTLLESGWAYRIPTVGGDCGSLIVLKGGCTSRICIGGIHVGGTTQRSLGFAQKVHSNMLNFDSETAILDEQFEAMQIAKPSPSLDAVVHQGNFLLRGNVKEQHTPYGVSKIRKSIVHSDKCRSYSTSKNGKSVLTPQKVGNDPYTMALSAYCQHNSFGIHNRTIDIAVEDASLHILRKPSKPRIYTFEEAVKGVEGYPYFKSINRAASAGFPYNVRGITKKKIFGSEGEYDLTTPLAIQVRANVARIENNAKLGKRMLHVYTDNLKDETLALEKVAIHKTRLFCGSPLEYTILVRQYFGSFMAYIQEHCIDLGMAIGVNPFSLDWHYIAVLLLNKGGSHNNMRYGAGDYKRFDGSEISFIHWKIFDIIDSYYNDEYTKVREILWYDLVNSNHIAGSTIYSWNNSLPSGHPLTSIVNSIYNHIAMCYCYYRIQENMEYRLTGSFYDNVYLIVMGDDNLFGVSQEASLFFTEGNIAEYMTELGLVYTSDTKDGANIALRTLNDVSFLKRYFRVETDYRDDGRYNKYCAPIDLQVILETPMWFTKSIAPEETILRDNIISSLKELSLHGKAIFNEWSRKILEVYYRECEHNGIIYEKLSFAAYNFARKAVSETDTIY